MYCVLLLNENMYVYMCVYENMYVYIYIYARFNIGTNDIVLVFDTVAVSPLWVSNSGI